YDEGWPLPRYPGRDLEENLWRAIRWGMSGELIDLAARRSLPARERLEQLLDQVAEVATELGIAPYLDTLRLPTLSERAGEPVVERLVTADQLWHYKRAVAELQLAFAVASRLAPEPAADQTGPAVETAERPKIWTPGVDV